MCRRNFGTRLVQHALEHAASRGIRKVSIASSINRLI
ncbi:hypothetical protein JWG42_00740 [Desulfoprunum benzoelyticum]|nr:hypothetical protein [Desulfoprunum benzoelyticum]